MTDPAGQFDILSADGGGKPPPATPRTHWTAPELVAAEFPEQRWAVPGLVAEGVTVLAGAPKIGKSWLVLDLAVAVAAGGMALGKVPVEAGPALFLALEDTGRRLQERLVKVLAGADPPAGLVLGTTCRPLDDGGAESIEAWLATRPAARLVVIDVLARVRGLPGPDKYQADYRALIRLKSIADRHHVTILVVHHTRKPGNGKPDGDTDFIDDVSGTMGLSAAADAVLVLRRVRGRADAVLQVTGRDIDEHGYALEFAGDIGAWQLLEMPASEALMTQTRAAIFAWLRSGHDGDTPKQVADGTGLDHELVKKTCRRMADAAELDASDGRYFVPAHPAEPGDSKNAGPMREDDHDR